MKDFDKMVQARLFDNTAAWPMARWDHAVFRAAERGPGLDGALLTPRFGEGTGLTAFCFLVHRPCTVALSFP